MSRLRRRPTRGKNWCEGGLDRALGKFGRAQGQELFLWSEKLATHVAMMRGSVVLGHVVGKVECAGSPIEAELVAEVAVAEPVKVHVHGFGLLGLDGVVDDAGGGGVIGLDWEHAHCGHARKRNKSRALALGANKKEERRRGLLDVGRPSPPPCRSGADAWRPTRSI
ncbi:hypothetical protein THAOC_30183 [Thalassiosira oceanica]|uniref:Uncharacterized protein n=1 Tax=Thalassiosira oceanica TaxID=159749 RepID=K0RAQ2_THAOC|nr:hypothetical protein THAOC_30183 [Thalassiosira oceanica]|eukprot:EJK50728.1 hypothetical protein THAOC_30183 [Thalassiosira oceanica]